MAKKWVSLSLSLPLAVALFHATDVLAQCQPSVLVGPGASIEVGRTEGKKFILDTSLAYGTMEVATSGTTEILKYTANSQQSNASEKVDCEIEGEGKKSVEVSIRPIPTPAPETVYGSAAKTLVLLFALAVLLESALAGVFRWRPFVELLNPRAVRPLVAFLLAWWFVYYFDLDMVTALVNASNPEAQKPLNPGGQVLTALVLAGGSSGVNSILVALGFRQVSTPETQPKPRPDKAWISVRAVRKKLKEGSIDVLIGPLGTLQDGTKEPPFVGTIRGKSGLGILAFFARDRGRYPSYGGFEVDPAQDICVTLKSDKANPKEIAVWGPHKLAPGAVVDLDLEV